MQFLSLPLCYSHCILRNESQLTGVSGLSHGWQDAKFLVRMLFVYYILSKIGYYSLCSKTDM